MVSVKYNILSGNGMDEIFIIAVINKGLKELEYFKLFKVIKYGDISVYAQEYYENGEYYTNAFFSKDKIDYYLIMMSPSYGQAEFYLESLLIGNL